MNELSSPSEGGLIDPLVELIGFRLSTATVLFHAAIADRLEVGATDVKCYSILRQVGAITAGELAERTSLTTGAITGVIDRLERAKLVRRARDPRRRSRLQREHQLRIRRGRRTPERPDTAISVWNGNEDDSCWTSLDPRDA